MFCEKQLELCIVTKNDKSKEALEFLEKLILKGVSMVQLCQDDLSYYDFLDFAKEVKKICYEYKVPLIIRDNIMIMKEIDADGIYLNDINDKSVDIREKIGDDKIIGLKANDLRSMMTAFLYGANYITIVNDGAKHSEFIEHFNFLKSVSPIPLVLEINHNDRYIKQLDETNTIGIILDSRYMEDDEIEKNITLNKK